MAQSVRDGIDGLYVAGDDLEEQIAALSWRTVGVSAFIILVVVIVAALNKNKYPKLKLPLFLMGSITMALSFFILAGSTVILNTQADSGGPVHWHADVEYWVCENEIELRNPTSALSNKIGTATLHEHNDHRIHLEGVVVNSLQDASLGKFMHVIDGAITNEAMIIPVNDPSENLFEDEVDGDGSANPSPDAVTDFITTDENGRYLKMLNGQNCGEQPSEVQVFVYQINKDDNTYTQFKLEDPASYVIRDESQVPPGDCIIFEFAPPKAATDKLCEQFGVKDIDRCESFGVTGSKQVCTLKETNKPVSVEEPNSSDISFYEDENTRAQNDLAALCEPYYDANGIETGLEVISYKADGEALEPSIDCAEYVKQLTIVPEDEPDNVPAVESPQASPATPPEEIQ